jgi:hypothetical protein
MTNAAFNKLKVNQEQVLKLPKAKKARRPVAELPKEASQERHYRDQADTLAGQLTQNGIPCITWADFKAHAIAGTYQAHWAVREFRFAEPERQWRCDFGWSCGLVAEVDGGQWEAGGGRHAGDEDYVKTCEVALHGFIRLAFTTNQVRKEPRWCVDTIKEALRRLGVKGI